MLSQQKGTSGLIFLRDHSRIKTHPAIIKTEKGDKILAWWCRKLGNKWVKNPEVEVLIAGGFLLTALKGDHLCVPPSKNTKKPSGPERSECRGKLSYCHKETLDVQETFFAHVLKQYLRPLWNRLQRRVSRSIIIYLPGTTNHCRQSAFFRGITLLAKAGAPASPPRLHVLPI